MKTPSNSTEISVEERLNRLQIAVAVLATELDDADDKPRVSAEYLIEKILYPEHFVTSS